MTRARATALAGLLAASCRSGPPPAAAPRSDAEADSGLMQEVVSRFGVSEVSFTRAPKVAALSLVDTLIFQLPESERAARAKQVARWTWQHLQNPAGMSRFWVFATAPSRSNGPEAGSLFSYWTRDLEPDSGASHPR